MLRSAGVRTAATPAAIWAPRCRLRHAAMRVIVGVAWLACVQGPHAAEAHPAPGPATPPVLKLSVVVAPAFALGKAAELWGEATTAAVQGAFTVKLYPGASLARSNAAQEYRMLAAGELDMAVGSAAFWSEAFPPLGALALPWIAPTDKQVAAVLHDATVMQQLTSQLDAAGLVLVYWAPLAHRDLATQRVAVHTVDDVKGMRLRVGTTPVILDTCTALGAKPGVMSYAVAQQAFATGELDGQDGTAATFAFARAWSSGTQHLNEWGAFADAMLFIVRKPLWEAWPRPLRDKVLLAAKAAARDADALGREHAARETLLAHGVSVTRLTPAGHALFRAAAQPIYERFTPLIGAPLVAAVDAASRQAGE